MSGRTFIIRRQKRSVQQEKSVATKLAGRRVAGSGSLPGMKGDVNSERWLVECKFTDSKGFRVTLPLWWKIEKEAIQKGKLPVMILEIAGRSLAVIDFNDFLALQ